MEANRRGSVDSKAQRREGEDSDFDCIDEKAQNEDSINSFDSHHIALDITAEMREKDSYEIIFYNKALEGLLG